MPRALVPGIILDSRGAPYAPRGGYGNLHRRTRDDDLKRPAPPSHYADYAALLSSLRFESLVSESRALAARGLVSALIDSKAGYVSASHWRPRFEGADTAWGESAMSALADVLPIVNIRGSRFDWKSSWRLSTRNFADAGAFTVLLTSWPDTDMPALQFIEAHRIGQRDPSKNIVEATDAFTDITDEDGVSRRVRGAYRGLFINNGIITTAAGTEVAVRILGATKDDDQDVSLRDLILCGAPKSYSESRPAPDIAASLLDLLAIDLAQTAALDQQIADARRDLVEETATGRPDPTLVATGMAEATTAGTPTEVVERGMYRFVKTGNKITAINTTRPSDQWMNFDLRVVKRAAAAIRWRAEMLDPEMLRGGATRAFQDQINTLILDDFHATAPACARAVRYIVAKLIKRGDLASSTDWRRWAIAQPPWFQVDRASARIELEEVAAGRTSMSHLAAQDGNTIAEIYRQRASDYLVAAAIATETGVDIDVVRGVSPTISSGRALDPTPTGPAPKKDARDNPQLAPA